MGEGAGILVLERKDLAVERGAFIYGSVADVSTGADSSHPIQFAEDGSSIAAVLDRTFQASGMPDYVNLHGTGTRSNDVAETRAVRKVFGAEADRISFSSTKGSTGHLLGAAGSVEAAIALLAMRDGLVPPTTGLQEPDPACDLDYTPRRARVKEIGSVVSLSFGFGGAIGAVCFQKN
jgi:3-oxoacyl-[acyl-carrier-protein] synthase II